MAHEVTEGSPAPLGVRVDSRGINVAVRSATAEAIDVCLFDEDGNREVERIRLPYRSADVWHAHIKGIGVGARYGLRAHGPHQPEYGQRFNSAKLLIDPYARQLDRELIWHPDMAGTSLDPEDDVVANTADSAPVMPRCVVIDDSFDWSGDHSPRTPMTDTVIYEAHVKGLTQLHPKVEPELRGTYLGLASAPIIDHLTTLGVTAVELLPVQAFIDDRHLVNLGLRNYWGYQPCAWFAPEPRYGLADPVTEFKQMVKALHAAGIEVICDVVYNHSGEGNEFGPTISLRGLDNTSYYRLIDDGRRYLNVTGTGNTLDLSNDAMLQIVMDSLRYWVTEFHVDGFRFDLATTVARGVEGFDPHGPFLSAIRQDPVLSRVKLIAEPWDIGPGGYQLGGFGLGFSEWNDRFRDGVRALWRGAGPGEVGFGQLMLGSSERFDHGHRPATSSINMITAHDGFTLADVVSYRDKHNEANGEHNRDGHGDNVSDNFGVEGPSDDAHICAERRNRQAAMLASLILAQGVPMILAGDEIGNTQGGNNNAYCQDNETGWIDWTAVDEDLRDVTRAALDVRRDHPVLRQRVFLRGRRRLSDGFADASWYGADGEPAGDDDWTDPGCRTICLRLRGAAGDPVGEAIDDDLYLVFHTGGEAEVVLPSPGDMRGWKAIFDTRTSAQKNQTTGVLRLRSQGVVVLKSRALPV